MQSTLSLIRRNIILFRRNFGTVLKFSKEPFSNITIKPDFGNLRVKVEYESKVGKGSKTFASTWLVHNCKCPKCKQEFTGQKLIDVNDLRPFYTLVNLDSDDDEVRLTWEEDDFHKTIIPLADLLPKEAQLPEGPDSFISSQDKIPRLDYDGLIENEGFNMLKMLDKYGVCLIKDVPKDLPSLKHLVNKCGHVQRTIYGEFFDVISSKDAINIAYTDETLHPHMDLAYYESPPGLQFLHCLEFDPPDIIKGGETIIIDAWKTALLFKEQCHEHFISLAKIPATFQKIHLERDEPVHMKYKRPHLVLDNRERIIAINWSPTFEGPLDVTDPVTTETYYQAYIQFAKLLHDSPFKNQFRLHPGDVLCFNNRRMLHGKKAVRRNQMGRRHLRGCYVNIDEFKSKFILMAAMYEPDLRVEHVLNGSSF